MAVEKLSAPDFQEQDGPPSGLLLGVAQELQGSGVLAGFVDRQEIHQDPRLMHVQDVLVVQGCTPEATEPTVRVYRGIRPRQPSEVLEQRAYLLKRLDHETGQTKIESDEAHTATERFMKSGRFKDLISAVGAADMSEDDRKFVDGVRLRDIAQSLIRYPERTLRQELAFQHISAPGGHVTQDVSPYVATSLNPDKAIHYGSTFMVLDVPVSAIEGRGEADELLVGMQLKPEWIRAIADIKRDPRGIADGEGQALAERLGMTVEQASQQRDFVETVLAHYAEDDKTLLADNIADAHNYLIGRICALFGDDAAAIRQRFKDAGIHDYRLAARDAWHYVTEQQTGLGRFHYSLPEGEVPDERQLRDSYELLQSTRERAKAAA